MSIITRLLNQRLQQVERELDRYEEQVNSRQKEIDIYHAQMQPLYDERGELNAALWELATHAQQEL